MFLQDEPGGNSPRKSRGMAWKDDDVKQMLLIMQEETIFYAMDNDKTPNEKRAAYTNVQVKLHNKGKIRLEEKRFSALLRNFDTSPVKMCGLYTLKQTFWTSHFIQMYFQTFISIYNVINLVIICI